MKIPINIKSGVVESTQDVNKEIIIGIDLGTTNSLVAYIEDGIPQIIKDKDNSTNLVPSVIFFEENDKPIVGVQAKEHVIQDPTRTIYSVKRLLGQSYADIETSSGSMGYKILSNTDDESLVKVVIGDRYYNPVELSAIILKTLKSSAESHLGQPVRKAVITVPAYFNDSQRQATRDAGKLAGLDVLRIINEPTAASLAYGVGVERAQRSTVVVYDLGGGTFDVSILSLEDGIFEVLATHGDTHLGGDDIDQAIIQYWTGKMGLKAEDLLNDKSLGQLLRTQAELAKKHLTYHDVYQQRYEDYVFNLQRETLEKLIKPLVEKTLHSCQQSLQDAQLKIKEIDEVILVGGSTRIPLVKSSVQKFFNRIPKDDLNPDEVVALGAAIQADILAGNRKDLLLLDITPLSLGIETVGGLMDTIIARNSKVPSKAGRQYTTSVDGQKNLKVAVYQGERELVQNNRKLGEFILRDIPPMAAGLPKIDIQFVLDADGILTVKATELRSDTQAKVEIKSTYGISEEEMAKMLLDSIQNANQDMKARGVLEAINEANNLLLSGDKFVNQNKNILTIQEMAHTVTLMDELRNALSSDNKDTIQTAITKLNDYTSPLAHRALDHNIQATLKGKDI